MESKNRTKRAGLVLALIAMAGSAGAQAAEFPELGLTIRPPEVEGLLERRGEPDAQTRCVWTGTLNGSTFRMDLIALTVESGGFREAGGVTEAIVAYFRGANDFEVDESWYLTGEEYGFAPVLAVVSGVAAVEGEVGAEQFIAGGLTKEFGYALYIRVDPPLSDADRKPLLDFFENGISYDGPTRDPDWTLDEIKARWLRDAPEDLHDDFLRNLAKKAWVKKSVIRTKNYLIMTNASGGKLFAKKMDENLKEIAKVFPFTDVKGRRLMPVFLFRTPEEYYGYYVKVTGASLDSARRSKGFATRDFYATWYEAPKDPVHIHEQVHQIFSNRLLLGGGGSWFQEGVAEYVETSENDRNVAARQVKAGKHMPLAEFFEIRSLLWSTDKDRTQGGSAAGDLYKQAALFIEFLRESKWGKDKFDEFLYTVGYLRRNDVEKIGAAFDEIYDASIDDVDAEFRAYCAKR